MTPATSTTIAHLSFEELRACCSLSNRSRVSLFFHRVSAFFKTGSWISDAKIGKALFCEYLHLNSIVSRDILQKNYGIRDEVLAKIDVISRVFQVIVFPRYRQIQNKDYPSLPPSIVEENSANPEIRDMFPIRVGSLVGASLVKTLQEKIFAIGASLRLPNRQVELLKGVELQSHLKCVHFPKVNQTIEASCWSQRVSHPLLPRTLEHKPKCTSVYDDKASSLSHKVDSKINMWWTAKKSQAKLKAICEHTVTFKMIDEVYPKNSNSYFPYKLALELS